MAIFFLCKIEKSKLSIQDILTIIKKGVKMKGNQYSPCKGLQ